jgi:hypothetical protein
MAEEAAPKAGSDSPSIVRTPDFVSIYANAVQVETTAWDMTIMLGQFDKGLGPNAILQRAAVTLAWAEAKAVCNILLTNLAFYEHFNGPIKMPKGMTPDPIDTTQRDPKWADLDERVNRLREVLFGEA